MPVYRNPPDVLSQGDLITDVPWGLIEAPVTLCRPANTQPFGKADYSTAADWKLPGQSRPKAWAKTPEVIHATGYSGWAVSLWHDCEIDKPANAEKDPRKAFAAVAPIFPITTFPDESTRDAIRAGSHHAFFHLPAVSVEEQGANGGFALPESAVAFRYIWSVRQLELTKRKASLTPDAIAALYQQLFVFLTRTRLDISPTCPTCGVQVELRPTDAQAE